ncbi:hypothetical protein FHX37_2824 [Haloactinospora alba]|uniref:Uncharacterized protein n=1 Tax=Haloactinospora alba TaxID=405555 RepID=A0A543NM02_9ACTN|nr:hypothetical protein [Haloactinospora alba]TQN32839.1 hypothetical protein FHX37_2824 [Haloactinospora alba]
MHEHSSSPDSAVYGRYSPQHPLFALAKELERHTVAADVDVSISVVDAWPPNRFVGWRSGAFGQRAILRPDPVSAHPWWWLLWPGERFRAEIAEPQMERLLPVEDAAEVARRVRNILILHDRA